MLSDNYAECRKQAHYAECRYAECHYAECSYAEYRGAINRLSLIKKILDLNKKIYKYKTQQLITAEAKKFDRIEPWGLYHKTYYGRKLRFP